jgi:Tol biopolymer transport system component
MRSDGGGGRLIRRAGNDDVWESPAFSPSGKWLAFSDFLEKTLITRFRREAKLRSILHDESGGLWRYSGAITQPAWGSNGRLALTLGGWRSLGATGHIGTVTRNATDLRLVTRSASDGMADWSPRADRIVFQRSPERSSRGHIFVTSAKPHRGHRRPHRLTPARDAFLPVWSPDGRYIAYVRVSDINRQTGSLWIMRVNGGGQRLVAAGVYASIGLSKSRISWQPRPGW